MCWDLFFLILKLYAHRPCSVDVFIQYKKSSEPLPQEYDVLCAQ